MAKMKLSTRLRKAANERLWDGYGSSMGREIYSCDAVHSLGPTWTDDVSIAFLRDLGTPVYSVHAFPEFKIGPERQSVRYAWLMFAAMYAEELGK